jgi:hypothetical protein
MYKPLLLFIQYVLLIAAVVLALIDFAWLYIWIRSRRKSERYNL